MEPVPIHADDYNPAVDLAEYGQLRSLVSGCDSRPIRAVASLAAHSSAARSWLALNACGRSAHTKFASRQIADSSSHAHIFLRTQITP